jgi:hypothetical protein
MPTSLRAAALVTTAIVCTAVWAEETSEVTIDKLKFSMPTSWKQAETTSSMRLAQFTIPAKAGDQEPGSVRRHCSGQRSAVDRSVRGRGP